MSDVPAIKSSTASPIECMSSSRIVVRLNVLPDASGASFSIITCSLNVRDELLNGSISDRSVASMMDPSSRPSEESQATNVRVTSPAKFLSGTNRILVKEELRRRTSASAVETVSLIGTQVAAKNMIDSPSSLVPFVSLRVLFPSITGPRSLEVSLSGYTV